MTLSGIGPVGAGGGELGAERALVWGLLGWGGCELVGAGVAAACMSAEVCCAREASRDGEGPVGGVGGIEVDVVAAAVDTGSRGCCCGGVEESHRVRRGSRKVGGRRVMGFRSSSAVRKRDLLILEGWAATSEGAIACLVFVMRLS